MSSTGPAGEALLEVFDRRFREDPDPWRFEASPYELAKRAATIAACEPDRRESSTLELGAANGVLAAELAAFSDELVAIEGAPAAAELARERLAGCPGARVITGLIPEAVPQGPHSLVVASEILYYLGARAYAQTLAALPRWLAPAGRLVAVHWRPTSAERPRSADTIHADLRALPGFEHRLDGATADYRLDVFERASGPAAVGHGPA